MDKWLGNITVVRIAAVIIGILLWAFVQLDQQVATPAPPSLDPATTIQSREIDDFPITEINLGEDLEVTERYSTSVNVILRGNSQDIQTVSKENEKYQIQLDLLNKSSGTHQIKLNPIGFPDNVDVELYPPVVTITIEEIITTALPIQVNVKGEPGKGYTARNAILSVEETSVTGTKSVIEKIKTIYGSVDITNVHEDLVEEIKLIAFDEDWNQIDVEINPATVEVQVPIISPSKTLDLSVDLRGETPKGYSVVSFKQSVDEVKIYGPQEVLNEYNVYDEIEIDLSNLTSDRTSTHILTPPDGISLIEPQKAEVEIIIVPSETKTFADFPITIIGLDREQYEVAFNEPTDGLLDIVVEGAPSILENVSENNISAIVDLTDLPPGSYERSIQLTRPIFVKYGGELALKVSLEIRPIPEEIPEPEITDSETNGITDEILDEPTEETESPNDDIIDEIEGESGIPSDVEDEDILPISEESPGDSSTNLNSVLNEEEQLENEINNNQ
ncbi:CdaR family protein [Chengkuizengella axinellae]|uniref:CdaR family protein n=1 Tax=Chengkuizengella axinellae TaxID=3064388 RepID=A0ABT9J8B7_9BACL|nr:CdaR family protein [Chengkuizengella sp. 2205SS18-9]MDP5277169.1 CdaR family protein [Chengkuizengella sp. 2205SS18-9]